MGNFTHLQHWIKHPSAPGSLLGQEVGAHQAQLLVSGLQAVWSTPMPKAPQVPWEQKRKNRAQAPCWKQCWKLLTAHFHGSSSARDEGFQHPPKEGSTSNHRLITWLCTFTHLWDTRAVVPSYNLASNHCIRLFSSTFWNSNYQRLILLTIL